MKIIDCSKRPISTANMSLVDRVLGTIQNGFSWYDDLKLMENARTSLSRLLDPRFTMLVNCPLPGIEEPAPFIIVGPTGIQIVYATALKGVYRAKADAWSLMENGHYHQVRPNLMKLIGQMIEAVQGILLRAGLQAPVDGVLLCLDTGMHVETVRPVVRVVMQDGMSSFAAGLQQGDVNLPGAAVQAIAVTIQQASVPPEPDPEEERRKAALLAEKKAAAKKRARLTPKQTRMLAIMAGAEVLLLIIIIIAAILFA